MMRILKETWVFYGLERRVFECSYVVSGLWIRDMVLRLSADWMVILENKKLKGANYIM
jgi:hypothetical protein